MSDRTIWASTGATIFVMIAIALFSGFGVGIFVQSTYHPIVQTTTEIETVTVTVTTTAPPPVSVLVIGKASTLGLGTHATAITFQSANGFTMSPALNSTGFYNVTLPNGREYTVTITGANTVTGINSGTCQIPGSFILDIGAGTRDLRMDWGC